MAKITLAILLMVAFASCDKGKNQKLNGEELKTKYAIVLPDLQYDGDEIATSTSGKGGNKQKASAVFFSVTTDLTLNEVGDSVTFEVSPNAHTAAIQKFVSTSTNNGAISFQESIRRYDAAPGAGVFTSAGTTGTGFYRGWSCDFDNTVHLTEQKEL